jgi:hypothetical protein
MHIFGTVVADIGRDRLSATALHVLRGRVLERRVIILTTASIVRGFSRCTLEETDGWGFVHRVSSARPLGTCNLSQSLHVHDSFRPLDARARADYLGTVLEQLEASRAPVAYRRETLAWCMEHVDRHDDVLLPLIMRADAVWRSMSSAARESAPPSPATPPLLAAFCAEVHAAALCKCLSAESLGDDIREMVEAWADRGAANARQGARLCRRAVVLAPRGKQSQVARILEDRARAWEVESHTFQHGVCRGFTRWRRRSRVADACLHLLMHLRKGARGAVRERVYAEGVLSQELSTCLRETRIFVLDIDAAAEIADVLAESSLDALFLPWPQGAWASVVNTAIHVPRRAGTLEGALLASGSRKRGLR